MSASVLRFPALGNTAQKASPIAAPVPALDTFGADKAKTLHSILENAVSKSKELVSFVHKDRELASLSGVEGIGVEIAALLDCERFQRVRDALSEAVRLGEGATITHEGLAKLHRLEALVAEGSETLGRAGRAFPALSGRRLGSSESSTRDLVAFGAIVILGAVALTLTALLIGKRRDPVPFFGQGRVRQVIR